MADESDVTAGERGQRSEDAPEPHPAFDHLAQTVRRLREPGGCPWDREQTHATLVRYMVEEAYEAADAMVEASTPNADEGHLCEELGDVLYQVLLNSEVARQEGAFTIDDVCRAIDEKLIRRHPHVFAGVHVDSPEEVSAIWDEVKREEREEQGAAEQTGLLDSVPESMPALMQCQKISKRAAAAGFEWPDEDGVWDKVAEERQEFLEAPAGSDEREIEFGDLLFSLVNVARFEGIDAERALAKSNRKFRQRWSRMESWAHDHDTSLEELSTAELNELWDRAKQS